MTAEEKVDAIRAAHVATDTSVTLGRKLGCSRNAIIGVYGRRPDLKVSHPLPESSAAKAARRSTPLPPKKAKSMAGLKWISTKVSDEPLPGMPPAPATARRCRLHELDRHECKWPVDEVDDVHLFCGLPKRPERVYCDEHHALAYRPVPARKLYPSEAKGTGREPDLSAKAYFYGRTAVMMTKNKRLTKPSIKA